MLNGITRFDREKNKHTNYRAENRWPVASYLVPPQSFRTIPAQTPRRCSAWEAPSCTVCLHWSLSAESLCHESWLILSFQWGFESVFVALLLATPWSLTLWQFSIQKLFRTFAVWDAGYMTCPSELRLHQQWIDARNAWFFQHLCVRYAVLPADFNNLPKAC